MADYSIVQADLKKSAKNILKVKRNGKSPVLTVGLCPTETAFTGDLTPSVGVMRGTSWHEQDSATIGHLASFFNSIGEFLEWCLRISRNSKGQSIVAIDQASVKNWQE